MDGKLDWLAAGLPVEGTRANRRAVEFARDDVPTCDPAQPIEEVRDLISGSDWDVCVVVNQEGVVMGLLRGSELGERDEETAEQAMRPGPNTFRPHVDIEALAHHMAGHDVPLALITTSEGRLLGALTQERALSAADDREEQQHHHEEVG